METNAWPYDLLALEDRDALPEDNSRHFELVEGVLVVAPKPPPLHQRAIARLAGRLDDQLPRDVVAVPMTEVLVDPVPPSTVRGPDVVVVRQLSVGENPARFDASEVLLAVEITSPGTRRTDRLFKPIEYAEAGIPHYWLVELDEPITLVAFSLVAGTYKEVARGTGKVEVVSPFPVVLDLDELLRR
jgi:Uma2 family endonuclease